MATPLTIYGFETSNNMKVRVALGYKRLPYRFETVDPADRARIRELSGQNLTPVMVHGDRVLFDSAAILRYLDANYPETPRLFGNTREAQIRIEEWEAFGRFELAAPMMEVVLTRVGGGTVGEEQQAACQARFEAAVGRVIEGRGEGPWLVGDTMTAADITVAAPLFRIRESELFRFPAGSEVLDLFIESVMAYDGDARQA